MRSLLVAAVLLLSSTAHADEAADRVKAMTAVFTATTSKINDTDEWFAMFKKTLAPDALVWWVGSDYPRKDFNGWQVGTSNKVKAVGFKAGWAGTFGWVVAELKINYTWYAEGAPRKAADTFHYLAVFVPDGKDVKAKLVHLVITKPDSELGAMVWIPTLPTVASPSATLALLAQPKELAAHLSSDPATSIVGTSNKDHAFGAAAAKKLLGSWSKLGLELVTNNDKTDKESYTSKEFYAPQELAIGDATIVWAKIRMKFPHKNDAYLIDGLAVFKKTGDKTELVALQYDAD